MTAPSWKDVLPAPPPGGSLREAWLTSFEQPDARLLVEHLLPSLLGTSHSLSQEIQERTLFFGEMSTALEALHGRLTAISSSRRATREDSPYPWLWRYVSHFIVGAKSRAVQHAKLWAFHWKVDGEERLELYVSSTNLTTSAFKDQIQAGWQVCLPLRGRANQRTRRTWGSLVPFLDALGVSAGDTAATRIQRLVTLLGRVECPADVTFVASIPGQTSAARQLKQFKASEIHVLTPTIGEWNGRTLSTWSKDVGVHLSKVHLKWISTEHPWAAKPDRTLSTNAKVSLAFPSSSKSAARSNWVLSTNANATLAANGVQVECLSSEARFTEQHRDADSRWSHAKLYLLRSRRKRRLLVTSANWSPSAWGAGNTSPRNFELGVVFESEWTDIETFGEPFEPPNTVPFCVDPTDSDRMSALEWVEASWDGTRVLLRARSSDLDTPVTALVTITGRSEKSLSLVAGVASTPWKESAHPPLTAQFIQGTETLIVNILDLRSPIEFVKTPLPEVDPALARALREAFLLERYGGPVVDLEALPDLGGVPRLPRIGAPAADYSVQAWIEARAAFSVIDKWRVALKEAAGDSMLLQRVQLDGKELRALYAGRAGVAGELVAEELGWRLSKEA